MKKIIFLAALLLSISGFSQIKIGVKANFGGSLYSNSDNSTTHYSNGTISPAFQVGAVLNLRLTEHLSLQPELLYSQTSSILQRQNPGIATLDVNGNISYSGPAQTFQLSQSPTVISQIQVPINIKLSSRRAYGLLGVWGGLALSNKTLYYIDQNGSPQSAKTNTPDFGVNIGGGVYIIKKIVSIDLKYMRGFLEINTMGYKNNYLSIGVTALF